MFLSLRALVLYNNVATSAAPEKSNINQSFFFSVDIQVLFFPRAQKSKANACLPVNTDQRNNSLLASIGISTQKN